MAEAAFKQMIANFVRQTRPQTFRRGKPQRYPQRSIATAATSPSLHYDEHDSKQHTRDSSRSSELASVRTSRLDRIRADTEPRSFSSFLTDNYAREHNYLRISVTERCNLRCLYCMPEEGVPLSPSAHILTTPEIVYLSSLFVSQGVDKIRLTGGEPTVRKDIVDMMRQIGSLRKDGLKELCLTTNGISLHRKLDAMVEAGLTGVNLSLDTLDPFQFTIMTRRNGHEAVMKSIRRILDMNKAGAGVKLKINCVVMRGVNESEIVPFVEMGKEQDLEVRFIEYMPFDGNKWSQRKMLSFQEMLALIREKYPDVCKIEGHANDTSKTYQVPGFVGKIGFITSMTHNFCGTCNRLRITSDGNLKVCLFGNSEVSLRDILREANDGKPIDREAMDAIKQIEMDRRQSRLASTGPLGFSEREARLLEVIGMAVKRKKAKHAEDPASARSIPQQHQPPAPYSKILPIHQSPSSMFHMKHVPLQLLQSSHASSSMLRSCGHPSLQHNRNYSVRRLRTVALDPHPRIVPIGPSDDSVTPPTGKHGLSHLGPSGAAHMVDISEKRVTNRSATASALLTFSSDKTYKALKTSSLEKGDAIAVARIAAIQAAKRTADLIPLAHPGLGLTGVTIEIEPYTPHHLQTHEEKEKIQELNTRHHPPSYEMQYYHGGVRILATVSCHGKTGVEMEALTAANIGALTMYDMLKGIDKRMTVGSGRVLSKRGGKSGDWVYDFESDSIRKVVGDGSAVSDSDEVVEKKQKENGQEDQPALSEYDIPQRLESFKNLVSNNKNSGLNEENDLEEEKEADDAQNSTVPAAERPTDSSMNKRKLHRTKALLEFKKMKWHEERLVAVQEKTRYLRDKYDLERQKVENQTEQLRLIRLDIQEEIDRGIREVTGVGPAAAAVDDSGAQGTNEETPNSTSASVSPAPSAHSSDSAKGRESGRENFSHGDDGRDQGMRFIRSSMSGTFPDRVDAEDFRMKRIERYEKWKSER